MSTNIKPMSVPTKRLANSITSIATSMTLNNILDWGGDDLTATSFSNSTGWPIVMRNETNTLLEFAEIDTTTLSGNTYHLTKRGLSYNGGVTSGEADSLDWNGIETIIELGSNPPQLYEDYLDHKTNESVTGTWDITSTGQWTFNRLPSINVTPVSSSDLATKGYVDAAGITPTPYASNVISGAGSTSYTKGIAIYYSSSDQLWYPTIATATSSFQNKTLGITQSTSNTSGDTISILTAGASTSVSTGMTPGTKYYLGDTTGTLGTTSTYEVYMGYALSSTNFLLEQRRDDMPFAFEKDALAGLAISTSAVPATANPYLTKYDTTSAVTTGCLIPLRNSTGDIIVNTVPQSATAAASKDYVDLVSAQLLKDRSVNTIATSVPTYVTRQIDTYFSTTYPLSWTFISSSIPYAMYNYVYISASANDCSAKKSLGSTSLTFASTKEIILNFNLKPGSSSASVQHIAFGMVDGGTLTTFNSTSLSSGSGGAVKFLYLSSGDTLYGMTDDGSTSTLITLQANANPYSGLKSYTLWWDPTQSAKFYVNGVLKGTSTGSLPASQSSGIYLALTGNDVGSNTNGLYLSNITMSYEI
jgi:hypothetical protein